MKYRWNILYLRKFKSIENNKDNMDNSSRQEDIWLEELKLNHEEFYIDTESMVIAF